MLTTTQFVGIALGATLLLSAVSFALMAWDKRAAAGGRWRTRERTLHVLEALGGWPGSLLASAMLRHKSRKLGYRLTRFGCIVVHLAAVAALWHLLWAG